MAATDGANDVFVNCPFDDGYRAIFEALIFTIYSCGFRPRSARELDDGGQARLDKLYGLIGECRYGIHDLSRSGCDPETGMARFNMPLELGIFLGAKRFGGAAQKLKRAMILDTTRFRYQQFISDLAGMDIHAHGGDPLAAAVETRDWLANVSRRKLASGPRIARAYRRFVGDLPTLASALEFDAGKIPYVDFERIVVGWLVAAPAAE